MKQQHTRHQPVRCWAKSGPTRCYPPTPPPLISFLVSVGDAWWRAIHSGAESRSGAPLPPRPNHIQLDGKRNEQHRRIDVCMWVGVGETPMRATKIMHVALAAHCCAASSTHRSPPLSCTTRISTLSRPYAIVPALPCSHPAVDR